jgi:hypothetical protein
MAIDYSGLAHGNTSLATSELGLEDYPFGPPTSFRLCQPEDPGMPKNSGIPSGSCVAALCPQIATANKTILSLLVAMSSPATAFRGIAPAAQFAWGRSSFSIASTRCLRERRFRLLCESVNSSRAAADCGAGAGKGRACRLKEGRARTSGLSGCSTTMDVTNAVIEKLARPYHTPGTSR